METADVLKKAWLAVEDSGVPESLYESAFKAAVAHLTETAGPPSAAQAPPTRPTGASAMAAPPDGPADVDATYQRLSAESGVGEDAIREVLLFEDDGDVAILTPGRSLGKTTSAKARNVAALIAGAYFGGLNKRSVPLETLRAACDDRGCYDHKNFKTSHIGNHDALSVRNSEVHIIASKWAKAFEDAVNQARGAAA